jgi:hypothetical protein
MSIYEKNICFYCLKFESEFKAILRAIAARDPISKGILIDTETTQTPNPSSNSIVRKSTRTKEPCLQFHLFLSPPQDKNLYKELLLNIFN